MEDLNKDREDRKWCCYAVIEDMKPQWPSPESRDFLHWAKAGNPTEELEIGPC